MSEDDDASDELGETAEKMEGIANRFSGQTETSETTDVSETSETPTEDAPDMTETTEMSETSTAAETSETTDTTESQPGDAGFQIREDWNGRTVYLPDEVIDDVDIRYQECSLAWQREHGEQLPKNERFYPAIFRAALNETTIEAELGLDEKGDTE